jgi:hypothetical protein
MNGKPDLHSLIARLSNAHCLKEAPDSYVSGFIAAAQNVYSAGRIETVLQEKFFIPNDAQFDLDTYLHYAAELSVQNHLRRSTGAENFEIDRQVNPPKDVDAYYEIRGTHVSLEVKCANEQMPSPQSLVVKTVGRVLDHRKTFDKLKSGIENPRSGHTLELAKNKDNTMRDFLVNAQTKFSPDSGFDDLNVLLVACGYAGNVQDWWQYLYGSEELFTAESFHPPSEYRLVDVVLLSNLKYLHTDARQFHDWTLQNAFLLPCLNRHKRQSLSLMSIENGLSVFNHHLTRFAKYTPVPLSSTTPDYFMDQMKVGHYIFNHLEEAERDRYFPVKPIVSPPP